MKGASGRGTLDGLLFGTAAIGQMERLWKTELEWLIVWLAVLAILVALARYVTGKIRPMTEKKERAVSQWLSKCGDLHSRGELSDAEFRTIKTTVATQLQDELSDNGEKG